MDDHRFVRQPANLQGDGSGVGVADGGWCDVERDVGVGGTGQTRQGEQQGLDFRFHGNSLCFFIDATKNIPTFNIDVALCRLVAFEPFTAFSIWSQL